MAKHTDRVRIEEVDWRAVFPWVRLFGAFKMAAEPGKLLTSLLLVVMLYLMAMVIDPLAGRQVHPGELAYYRAVQEGVIAPAALERWTATHELRERAALEQLLKQTSGIRDEVHELVESSDRLKLVRKELRDHYAKAYADVETDRKQTGFAKDWEKDLAAVRLARQQALARIDAMTMRRPLMVAADQMMDATDRLARSLVTFNLGWTQTVQARARMAQAAAGSMASAAAGDDELIASDAILPLSDPTTTVAALRDLFVVIPGWLWHHHRGPLLLWLLLALPAVALLGGAVARMAAAHATRDERLSLREAMRFVQPRFLAFVLTPLMPLAIVLAVAALMSAGGFVIFNPPAWGIDILGGLLFGIAILCGFIIAAALLLTAMGIHLVYPAAAVNGSDVFDAIARAFNYVLNRPWRWLFYNAIAIFYGALTYLFLLLVIMLAAWATQRFVGQWVFTTTDLGANRFETILPAQGLSTWQSSIDYASLDWSGRVSAFLVHCWMGLLLAILPAYLVSYYLSVNTWIYSLLRRDADGIELEDLLVDPPFDPHAVPKAAEPAQDAAKDDDDEDAQG